MKILIVDDDHHIRDVFRMWLEREGFEIYDAENGKKELNYSDQHTWI
jgi:DNA-binding response OmpR family regulator